MEDRKDFRKDFRSNRNDDKRDDRRSDNRNSDNRDRGNFNKPKYSGANSSNYKSSNMKSNNFNSDKFPKRDESEKNDFEIEDSNAYIYGKNAVTEALSEKDKLSKIFIQFGTEGPAIDKIMSLTYKFKIPTVKFDRRKFADLEAKIGARGNSQGVIALINQIENIEFEDLLENALKEQTNPLIIALDEISDPHNLGAIARSAECSGASGILLPTTNSVQVTPTAIKISAGALLHLKVSKVKSLQTTLEFAKELGYQIVGTEMEAEKNYYDADFAKPTILVIGSEGKGIRPSIQKICDQSLKIPMAGKINSLNASVSAGIILFEALKQRLKSVIL
ncbi:MAG: 23S rRNA (guanosine(2251)-2'-O)-methyltransferase RlmB [Candidatus Kapaibacteriota bacterium]|jgi:23S rRNA (guanosine2251-2'-O)-methyltransferase